MPYLYDLSELSSHTKMSSPNLDVIVGKLNETGHASKTHFSPTSFITDLPLADVISAYREVGYVTPQPTKKDE